MYISSNIVGITSNLIKKTKNTVQNRNRKLTCTVDRTTPYTAHAQQYHYNNTIITTRRQCCGPGYYNIIELAFIIIIVYYTSPLYTIYLFDDTPSSGPSAGYVRRFSRNQIFPSDRPLEDDNIMFCFGGPPPVRFGRSRPAAPENLRRRTRVTPILLCARRSDIALYPYNTARRIIL